MSWQATSWAARQSAGSTVRKAILLLVANDANASGICWSGQASIAADAECARETVSTNLKALEAAGILTRFERRRKDGRRTSDWIVLGPRWEDRGEMRDADKQDVPALVAEAATSCEPPSHDASSCDPDGVLHVSLTGGQETVSRDGHMSVGARERASEAVEEIFAAWISATDRDPNRTKLSPDRRSCIQRSLKEYGRDDCLAAVRNIGKCSDARNGYGKGTRFDDVKHALGDGPRVEKWRDWKPPAPGSNGGGAVVSQLPPASRESWDADEARARLYDLKATEATSAAQADEYRRKAADTRARIAEREAPR